MPNNGGITKMDYKILINNSPILGFLLGTEKKSYSLFKIVILFSISWVIGLLCSAIDNAAYIPGEKMGYIEDLPNYFFYLSFIISFHLFKILCSKFFVSFNLPNPRHDDGSNILKMVTFENDSVIYQKYFCNKIISFINYKTGFFCTKFFTSKLLFRVLIFVIFCVFCYMAVYYPFSQSDNGNWPRSRGLYPVGFYFLILKDFVFFIFLLPPILWRTILIAFFSVHMLKKIQKKYILYIFPLALDRVGGLKPIGDLSLLLFYTVSAPLLHLFGASYIVGFETQYVLLYPIYTLLILFVFFLPLLAVREPMKEAKNIELARLSNCYQNLFTEYKSSREKNENARLKNLLAETQKEYNQFVACRFGHLILQPSLNFLLFF